MTHLVYQFVDGPRRVVLTEAPANGLAGLLEIHTGPKTMILVHLRRPELDVLAEAFRAADNQTTRCLGCGADLAQDLAMQRVHLGGRRYAYTCTACGWIHSQVEEVEP